MKQIRQGDVLLVPVKYIPDGINAKEKGLAVLAHGEVTGHTHVIDEVEPETVMYSMTPEGARFVELLKKTCLKHEEHSAIVLVEGKMQQGFQVEDFGTEIRRVTD